MKFDEYIAGVDYSLTSPAVCVAKVVDNDITFENCTFHFLKQTKSQKSFDKIWRVMTKKDYDMNFKATLQNRQLDKRKYEWWKDEETYLDVDAPITQSMRDEEE